MPRDTLILKLLWWEARNTLRAISSGDRLVFVFAGGALVAYHLANFFIALHDNAAATRNAAGLWFPAVPTACLLLGACCANATARVTLSRAFSNYLLPQPLSARARHGMAAVATFAITAAFSIAAFAFFYLCCITIQKPHPALWSLSDLLAIALGALTGWFTRMLRPAPDQNIHSTGPNNRTLLIPGLSRLDPISPAWLATWSCNLPAGRLRITAFLLIAATLLVLTDILTAGASLAQHDAAPAAIGALMTGLAVFILTLRCHPLASPVLRSAPIGFLRSWLGLLRLPLALSFIFFALPAGIALAAQPSSWPLPADSGFGLLLLDGAYAIFAAYFMTAPLAAFVAFVTVLSYAAYKWFTYHDAVYICLAAFLGWLWQQTSKKVN